MFVKPGRQVNRVFVHCSASDRPADDDWRVIDGWHRQRGFAGIGYHFFIKKDGTVQLGRDIEVTPAAQEGHNKNTIAICVHGLDKHAFTDEQYDSLRALCGEINTAYQGLVTFHGHCEVSAKTCPVFDYKSVLSLDKDGHMALKETNDGRGTTDKLRRAVLPATEPGRSGFWSNARRALSALWVR